ncbi:uncharacterized protein J7T54_004435 [Emericellopsis cladophorae]|uniref:BZIP domain-containing protein n=1 Tax=Emericellopsis cladophorae TaxID=2686198 RepID=A0A9P9Y546_9HYPO|nr:uncharacterized protein J7T54_004435 [Emericellopsis cladophorae]KAI6783408.1 hypothetical protein J7T54_004435 [Emericellopsis cladophorae]
MSTPAQRANLARIRDNQRRSRARKREYLQELEQRLRTCELQGIEASAEVQMAARRVADENRLLREMLHEQGVGDDYILHYLQQQQQHQQQPPGQLAAHPDLSPLAAAQLPAGAAGSSVQPLQHLLAPRRPTPLGSNAPHLSGQQASRETSIASASTSASSLWDATPPQAIPSGYGTHHVGVGMAPGAAGMGNPTGAPVYGTPVYSTEMTPRQDAYQTQQQQHQLPPPQQQLPSQQQQQQPTPPPPPPQRYPPQQMQHLPGSSLTYTDPHAPFHPSQREYGGLGGY